MYSTRSTNIKKKICLNQSCSSITESILDQIKLMTIQHYIDPIKMPGNEVASSNNQGNLFTAVGKKHFYQLIAQLFHECTYSLAIETTT